MSVLSECACLITKVLMEDKVRRRKKQKDIEDAVGFEKRRLQELKITKNAA